MTAEEKLIKVRDRLKKLSSITRNTARKSFIPNTDKRILMSVANKLQQEQESIEKFLSFQDSDV